ncbi:hypothetical protein MTP99_012999 [Tenebrio molitor]|uniref:outer mitochondrial transmembrane helix translocase-like n=1 Tax=Tenebrio molitor TaxID=7067 RepID=UPI002703CF29|nr:hypothetical protein MTP99_012999 [Tenebrio molitor]
MLNITVITNTLVIGFVLIIGIAAGVKIFASKQELANTKKKSQRLLSALGFGELLHSLNEYELIIASQLVNPSEIDITFDDIAGLDNVIDMIKSNIILPLLMHPIIKKKSPYFQPPKGVLLHGPPGCGKTMIAKATAKEAKANFLNIEVPKLTNKWYGESEKLALAVFTLAEKLQPCIIFIDEIDTFLRSRDEDGHEVTNMMKAQFMILWDGLYSRKDSTSVMVLGATNRPSDVDEAIRRRMPAMFEIPLPNRKQRKALLKFMLKNETLDGDVDVEKLAELTEHFSSSDLKELCRNAVFTPVRDLSSEIMKLMIEDRTCDPEKLSDLFSKLRNINNQDFQSTLVRMKENKVVCDKVTTSCTHHHVN